MKFTVGLSCLLYRGLLFLYPSQLRHQFGPEMAEVFRCEIGDAYGEAGWLGCLQVWGRTGIEIMVVALPSHWRLLGVSMVSCFTAAGFFLGLLRLLSVHLR
jgi:disulfide bond formation protein DsbB